MNEQSTDRDDSSQPPRRAAAILCGGASRRMGRAKALLPWQGKTLLSFVVGVLAEVVDEVIVVSTPGLVLPDLGGRARVVEDREPGRGPLAGIREGLAATSADWLFVTATDAPFLTPDFVRFLFSFEQTVAPEIDGFVQSLTAVYPRSGLAIAERLLAEDRARPLFLLEECGYRKLQLADLPKGDGAEESAGSRTGADPGVSPNALGVSPNALGVSPNALGVSPNALGVFQNLNDANTYLEAVRSAADGARRTDTDSVTVELLGTTQRRAGVSILEVPIGTAREILEQVEARCSGLSLIEPDASDRAALPKHLLLSVNGHEFIRSLSAPVGPGERLLVLDAAAGG